MILLFFIIIGGIIASDLISKSAMSGVFDKTVIQNVLSFNYTENTGAAWSIGEGNEVFRWSISIFAVIAAFVAVIMFVKARNKTFTLAFGAGMFVAGTLGNVIDRISLGYVRDFIKLEFITFPIFNVADTAICLGCLIICFWFIKTEVNSGRQTG
jgi:signal peptidase II